MYIIKGEEGEKTNLEQKGMMEKLERKREKIIIIYCKKIKIE
jgi:hypothetical protein